MALLYPLELASPVGVEDLASRWSFHFSAMYLNQSIGYFLFHSIQSALVLNFVGEPIAVSKTGFLEGT